MRVLRGAAVGEPVLARSPDGEPAFWLVPFEIGARACGFARVDVAGRVVQISRFGATDADRASWPEADFFRQPPARVLEEVRVAHAGAVLDEPSLSYDGSPAKWAWRIRVDGPVKTVVFITPGGWHERPAESATGNTREG